MTGTDGERARLAMEVAGAAALARFTLTPAWPHAAAREVLSAALHPLSAWLGEVGYRDAAEVVLGLISERSDDCDKPCCASATGNEHG